MKNGKTAELARRLAHNRRLRKIVLVLVGAVLLLGILIAPIEKNTESAKINSMGDGLWFAITTVTGVGYGDMVPVTGAGRLVASLLQIFGVLLFGTIVAFVSVEVVRYQEDYYLKRMFQRVEGLEDKIDEMNHNIKHLLKRD